MEHFVLILMEYGQNTKEVCHQNFFLKFWRSTEKDISKDGFSTFEGLAKFSKVTCLIISCSSHTKQLFYMYITKGVLSHRGQREVCRFS